MWDSPSHWVIVAILAIALFGYKKLPDASRSLGRSLRIFKTEIKGMTEDDRARESAAAGVIEPASAPEQPAAPSAPPAAQTVPAPQQPGTQPPSGSTAE
jgi:sec-independent protein translocase protein TatA